MDAAKRSPALPWARNTSEEVSEQPEPAAQSSASIYDPQLATGERIQVKWQLTDEATGETRTKWWGAKLLSHQEAGNTPALWRFRYDASDDFEEEEADIRFLSARYLRHAEDEAQLRWARDGEVTAQEDSGDEDGGAEEEVVAIKDISAAYEDLEREMGQTMEQAALKELQTLDPYQQRFLVSGLKDYMDTITSRLKQVVDSNDENYVVTEDDVREILSGLPRRRLE